MASLDLRATRLDLANEVTDSASIDVTFLDESGVAIDLSSWTFTAPIVTLGGTPAGVDFGVAVNANVVTLTLAAGALERNSYLWGLVATSGTAETTWLAGSLLVGSFGQPSRRTPSTVTVTVDAGVTVTATINVGNGLGELEARVAAIEAQLPYLVAEGAP